MHMLTHAHAHTHTHTHAHTHTHTHAHTQHTHTHTHTTHTHTHTHTHTQVFDTANNSAPFTVTIHIMLVNDHAPLLLLDGTNQRENYSTVFYEGQDYLGGEVPVRLSSNLSIVDADVGSQYLSWAEVQLVGGEGLYLW